MTVAFGLKVRWRSSPISTVRVRRRVRRDVKLWGCMLPLRSPLMREGWYELTYCTT